MIDTHCHLLPGMDDGARTWDEALAMARLACEDGIRVVIATPHQQLGRSMQGNMSVLKAVQTFQERLERERIPVLVRPGAELAVSANSSTSPHIDHALTLGGRGRYVLLEAVGFDMPYQFEEMLFALQLRGFVPILAHPERIPAVVANPGILEAHVQHGLLLQVTSPSVLGLFGGEVRRTAKTLMQHHWVQLLASDAHNAQRRRPMLAAAMTVVTQWIGDAEARELVKENGGRILRDDDIPTAPYAYRPRRRRRWFLA